MGLTSLTNSQIPVLLVIAGMLFILVSLAKVSGKGVTIRPEKNARILLFPIGFVLLIAGILLSGAMDPLRPDRSEEELTPIEEAGPEIKITFPLNGAPVNITTVVKGEARNIPDDRTLWIIVYPHKTNDYHPATEASRYNGEFYFNVNATIGTENSVGDEFDILAVLADNKSHEEFKTYLDISDKNQVWPGIKSLPNSVKVYDRVTVIRK